MPPGNVSSFFKATEGETYTDPTFEDDWTGAKASGLLRGAYCFFHPKQDAKKQADHFISVVQAQNDKGELPPIIDLEVTDGLTKDKIIPRAKIWLDEVEQAVGRKPIIYGGVSFLETNFSELGGGPPAWTKDYPFWLGWYPNQYVGRDDAADAAWLVQLDILAIQRDWHHQRHQYQGRSGSLQRHSGGAL